MKNIRESFDDSLRPEYKRADFGEMVQGRYAITQVEFAELVRLLLACIGEDEGLRFIHHSSGNVLAGHRPGEWSYEMDNANQITLRYWLGEFKCIEEPISNQPCITTPRERAELQDLLTEHVRTLKTRVDAL
jgi:hypothetical protein